MGQVRENFNHLCEGRFHDEVDKAQLGLCDICRVPVEKLTDGELVHFFEVALCEELNEKQVGPQTAQFPGFGRVGDVGEVEHKLYEKLLVCGFLGFEVLVAHTTTQVAELAEVFGHVRRKHRLNDNVACALEISAGHVASPVIRGVRSHQLE